MTYYVLAFLVALLASLVATPLVRFLSMRLGFVDHPDGGRKVHATPVALGGGAAVLVASLAAIYITVSFIKFGAGEHSIPRGGPYLHTLFAASILIVAIGLLDDCFGMRGRYKLLAQFLVAMLLIYVGGLRIDKLSIVGNVMELGWFAVPFTLFWLLGAINAINLIDGIDGLAASVGMVLCLTMAAITMTHSHVSETIIILSLAGALLGFLRYNFAPASIYLGDAGSMLIGLVIGVAAIQHSLKGPATLGLAVPAAVWAIPILDSAAAIVRRKLTGRSLFAADRGHFHHSLLERGWTVRQAVLFIGVICGTTCISALLSYQLNNEWISILTVVGVGVFLISTKTFGHIELALLKDRFSRGVVGLMMRDEESRSRSFESQLHLQGTREWDKLWTAIIESAERYGLTRVKLSINVHSLHEMYYASWNGPRVRKNDKDSVWNVSHPLRVDEEVVGELSLSGTVIGTSTIGHIIQVLDFLEPIEEDVRHVLEHMRLEDDGVHIGQGSSAELAASSPPMPSSKGSSQEAALAEQQALPNA